MLKQRAKAAGFGQWRTHFTRKTFSVDWLHRGGDSLTLMAMAGWTSPVMVQRYIGEEKVMLAREKFIDLGDPADRAAKGKSK